MADMEKVVRAWERCKVCNMSPIGSEEGHKAYIDCEYTTGLYCRKDMLIDETLELLKEQQEQKEKWIRDIDLYIEDVKDSSKNPAARSAKVYAVGLSYGLNIAKEIIEGKRNHG